MQRKIKSFNQLMILDNNYQIWELYQKTQDKVLSGKGYKNGKTELVTMSPLVLAYLGDTVYETYIREYLIRQNTQRKS